MEPISPKHITVTDPFWAPRIRTVADIVLPYQWQVLHDQVPGAPKSSCIANFQKAAHAIAAAKAGGSRPTYPTDKWYYDNKNSQEKAFMGWVFQDSDLYKWLEAAAYAIPYGNRAYLTEKSREAVEIIAAAQEADGYLDTLYSINGLQAVLLRPSGPSCLCPVDHAGRAGPIGYCLPSSGLHLPHLWQRKAPRLSRPPAGRAGTGTTV